MRLIYVMLAVFLVAVLAIPVAFAPRCQTGAERIEVGGMLFAGCQR